MTMRTVGPALAAVLALAMPAWLGAAEPGIAIRAGDLKQQPFIDAARTGTVATNQAVSVVTRQGGWVRVESNGQSGWMRMLNVRLQAAQPVPGSSSGNSRSSFSALRTGSSGKTVTTGVKGLDESNIRGSTPDAAQVAALDALAVDSTEAASHAASSGLKEQDVAYLNAGRR